MEILLFLLFFKKIKFFIKFYRWACLLGIQLLQHTYIVGPVWVITVTPFGSYITVQIEITVSYSDSTLGYIQFFPVSISLEYASMKHVKRDKVILINET